MADDPRHQHTCDWNLYPEDRDDPNLCNVGCLDNPEGVAASRAYVEGRGCRCMCHSPNQPPLMVCVRERRCVLCGAAVTPHQFDGTDR